ncbi:MAG: polysaccharide deacetylase family protein [Bacteriovoracaceae bacterium]|nr:polysaccharide deacetylase family protein [Bacteriovoracaceae bacterium]
MMSKFLMLFRLLALFLFSGPVLAQVEFEKPDQFPSEDIHYIPYQHVGFSQYGSPSLKGSRKIVLTYDDGPDINLTPKLLDLLETYNVKATFFVVGEKITAKTLPILERMVNEGHIVASHDWKHINSNSLILQQFSSNLKKSILTLENLFDSMGVHVTEMYYRFPYGAYGQRQSYHQFNVLKDVSQELYDENCINFVFWDIDTADWVAEMRPADTVQTIHAHIDGGTAYRHAVVRNAQGTVTGYKKEAYTVKSPPGGGVILMHDIHARTIAASELLFKSLETHKIQVVPLSTVKEFSYEGKNCILRP